RILRHARSSCRSGRPRTEKDFFKMITLVTGGVRSGKTRFALASARSRECSGLSGKTRRPGNRSNCRLDSRSVWAHPRRCRWVHSDAALIVTSLARLAAIDYADYGGNFKVD